MVRKAVEMCLRVLKESNKSRFDRYSRQKQCIDHIPYYLSGLSRAHFSANLSRNSYMCNLCSCDSKKAWKYIYIYSGLYGIPTLDLCDTGAALYQLNEQANWDQVVELVRYKPVEGWWVCNEPIQRPAPSWFVCLIGRALHRYRRGQGFESRTSLIFFFRISVLFMFILC